MIMTTRPPKKEDVMHAQAQSESLDQSHSAPISDKKRQANQANAQKSTGPRTPEGKSRSSQNALRHGGFSKDTLLPSENPKPFYHFRRAWLQDFSPQTCSELFLTERAVSLAWRLHRLTQADTGLHFNALCNFETSIEKIHQKNPDEDPPIFLPPAMALTDAFESDSKPNPFDRLSKTEDRLQSMLHRILKQLQSLQKQRKDNPPPP
jgi:predicted DNA-binding helix-hairpin-helix protein